MVTIYSKNVDKKPSVVVKPVVGKATLKSGGVQDIGVSVRAEGATLLEQVAKGMEGWMVQVDQVLMQARPSCAGVTLAYVDVLFRDFRQITIKAVFHDQGRQRLVKRQEGCADEAPVEVYANKEIALCIMATVEVAMLSGVFIKQHAIISERTLQMFNAVKQLLEQCNVPDALKQKVEAQIQKDMLQLNKEILELLDQLVADARKAFTQPNEAAMEAVRGTLADTYASLYRMSGKGVGDRRKARLQHELRAPVLQGDAMVTREVQMAHRVLDANREAVLGIKDATMKAIRDKVEGMCERICERIRTLIKA